MNAESLTIATFNVRGLTKKYKQEQLARDITRYKIDISAIQESKVK